MIKKTLLFFSFISGLLLSLPWISTSFSYVMYFALVPLLLVEDRIENQKQSGLILFFYSLLTFILWNVLSTWWIAYVSFFGMLLITVLNAILMAGVWWMMHTVRKKINNKTGYFSLVVFWLTFEFLHFNWSLRWPWMTLGNGFANSVKWIQWYEFTGVLGGSLWILLTNILIFSVYKSISIKSYFKSIQLAAWVLFVVLLPTGWSLYRYSNYTDVGKTTEVVVLQPNVDPYFDKFSGMSVEKQVQRLISLTKSTVSDSTDFILAPETSLPNLWEDSLLIRDQTLQYIFDSIHQYSNASFYAGAITQSKFRKGEVISKTARLSADSSFYYDVFNSALMIDAITGIQIGHKSILVSGVEKIPFQEYFSLLGKYVIDIGGLSGSYGSSSQSSVFEGPDDIKIGSVICFESAFAEFVASSVKMGANLIFIITNDGWWKNSAGVRQHFSFARLRAIETRRSIARSANTGISGFINSRGDVIRETQVNSIASIRAKIRLNDTITFYVRYGDFLGRVSLFLTGLILVFLLIDWVKK